MAMEHPKDLGEPPRTVEAEVSVRRRPKPRLRLPGLRAPLLGVPRSCLQARIEDPFRGAARIVSSQCVLPRACCQLSWAPAVVACERSVQSVQLTDLGAASECGNVAAVKHLLGVLPGENVGQVLRTANSAHNE